MARLKSTYVEGDLTVEGNIFVDSIANPNGFRFPYIDSIETSSIPDRIIKFNKDEDGNNVGGIEPSSILLNEEQITVEDTPENYSTISSKTMETGNKEIGVALKLHNKKIVAQSGKHDLKLNRSAGIWEFN